MGGKALNKYNIETERKSTKDFLRICSEIEPIVNSFGIKTHAVKCYHTKATHGDLDLLLKIDHETYNKGLNIRNIIQDEFKPQAIHNNGGVYSFDYDKFQVDFIPVKEKNWEASKTFFDYDPSGNLMGKTAHKFGMKYGFEGLVYPFRNFNGRVSRDIVISRNQEKIFEFLGYDYEHYQKGFDTLHEIFDWCINSKYFNDKGFQFENLTHVDRKRNLKRSTYNEFLEYVEKNYIGTNYEFKRKSEYLEQIDLFFPESKLLEQFEELKQKDEENKIISEKFNGKLIMEVCQLRGKELGDAITNFKKSFNDNWREYALKIDSKQILTDFLLFTLD